MTCTSESQSTQKSLEKKKFLLSENISNGKEQNQWRDMKKVFHPGSAGRRNKDVQAGMG